ncbi:hypothetical protein SAMN05428642_1011213 [Flaviramulus basaltis]|uniref:MYXO-CTERM domain-containing protein n=1 Tax=Flaviramulus basaltis TaxID=369401 RepID=A0A1K2IF59_9FLAO|nr:hypothetical protein [Flaviramulus basaltis]SFZ90890.1 hypothetical protein SAMN05428642_1011213 [Flaviramulus basaltis]
MKTKNKNIFKKLIVLLAILAFSINMNALSNNKKGNNGNGKGHSSHGNGNGYGHTSHGNGNGYGHVHNKNCDHGSGDSIPLDGGLSILLVGAAAFGIKKLRE